MNEGISLLHALGSTTWGIILMVLLFEGSIFVHELGHFLAARRYGLKVDRFSIGFGPRVFGWTGKDGVVYQLSLLPLGGYVALPQLTDLRALEGEPSQEARDLPPAGYFEKMMVFGAGATFNMLFAIVLACVLWYVGVPTPVGFDTNMIGYVDEKLPGLSGQTEIAGPAYAAGLRPGDRVLTVDGHTVRNFRDLQTSIALGSGRTADNLPLVHLTYERAGVVNEVDVKPVLLDMNTRTGDAIRQIGITPAQELKVMLTSEDSPARRAGLKAGDEVVAFDGQSIFSVEQFKDKLNNHAAGSVALTINRPGAGNSTSTLVVPITPAQVPLTLPLAELKTGQGSDGQATLDLAPIYAEGSVADPTLPTAPAVKLVVARLQSGQHLFGDMQTNDAITAINGKRPHSVQEAVTYWMATPAGHAARLEFTGDEGVKDTVDLSPPLQASVTPSKEQMMVGLVFQDQVIDFVPPWRQFGDAVEQTLAMLGSLLNPHSDVGIKMLSGPVGIGRVLYQFSMDDIRRALWFTVILNINLAILNLLPIPVLDGGHMLMATIARLRGRALPMQVVMGTQGVFLVLIVGLMLYKLVQDSMRWIGDRDQQNEITQEQTYELKVGFTPVTAPIPATPANKP